MTDLKIGDLVYTNTLPRELCMIVDVRNYLQFPNKTFIIRPVTDPKRTREVVPESLIPADSME